LEQNDIVSEVETAPGSHLKQSCLLSVTEKRKSYMADELREMALLMLMKNPELHVGITFSCTNRPTYRCCALSPPIDTGRSDSFFHEVTAIKKSGNRQLNGFAELNTTIIVEGAITDAIVLFGDTRE
jgi:hypothetical protein